MRLSPQSQQTIRETAEEVFGEDVRVKVFGSRALNEARGGDLDLLIELPKFDVEARRKSLRLVAKLQMKMGDQPIDVLVVDPAGSRSAIQKEALRTGVLL